ncbi:MAG: hypothetical protein JWN24_3529 [Phycisphaerales bacterium]|nr:hypothetical protein [Phycisphaerales bacterium]
MFFTLRHDSFDVAWANHLFASEIVDSTCPICSRQYTHGEGVGRAEIETGTQWPDVIGTGLGPSPMFSQRVVSTLHEQKVRGFEEQPVEIYRINDARLRALPPPRYYYFKLIGKIEVDVEAVGAPREKLCPGCRRMQPGVNIRRFLPLPDTWDGSDIFAMSNAPGSVCCTERVLLLARREQWTNCRFEPIDVAQRHSTSWEGVDYLGAAWPPTRWYPDAPSHGKSLQQWLEVLRVNRHEAAPVFKALLDFRQDALPPLLDMLRTGSDTDRRNAAEVLWRLRREEGAELDDDTKARIRKALPDLPDSLLR